MIPCNVSDVCNAFNTHKFAQEFCCLCHSWISSNYAKQNVAGLCNM